MHFYYHVVNGINYCEVTVNNKFWYDVIVRFEYSWVSRRWIFVEAFDVCLDDTQYGTPHAFEEAHPGLLNDICKQLVEMRRSYEE